MGWDINSSGTLRVRFNLVRDMAELRFSDCRCQNLKFNCK